MSGVWSVNSLIPVPDKVIAYEGTCVEVPCHTQPHHQRVIWYKHDPIHWYKVYDSHDPTGVIEQFRGRTSVHDNSSAGDCTLRIDNIRAADNNIKVYVWIEPGRKMSKKVKISFVGEYA